MTEIKKLLSFHGKTEVKEKYVQRVLQHKKLDEITQGIGFDKTTNKGCAIGCTLDNYDHSRYPIELGIPEGIARLEDYIFEALPVDQAKEFPLQLLEAVPVGVDLSKVSTQFFLWTLTDETEGLIPKIKDEKVKALWQAWAYTILQSLTVEFTTEQWKDLFEKARSAFSAYLAYRADLADLAYRAYLAYLADLA